MKHSFKVLLTFFILIPVIAFGYGLSIDLNKIKDTLTATQNLTLDNDLEQEIEIGLSRKAILLCVGYF